MAGQWSRKMVHYPPILSIRCWSPRAEPEILTWPETDAIKVEGVVVEALPNATYRVELANGHRVLALRAGQGAAELRRVWRRVTK